MRNGGNPRLRNKVKNRRLCVGCFVRANAGSQLGWRRSEVGGSHSTRLAPVFLRSAIRISNPNCQLPAPPPDVSGPRRRQRARQSGRHMGRKKTASCCVEMASACRGRVAPAPVCPVGRTKSKFEIIKGQVRIGTAVPPHGPGPRDESLGQHRDVSTRARLPCLPLHGHQPTLGDTSALCVRIATWPRRPAPVFVVLPFA